MATAEQFNDLLDLFKQQMETITALRTENEELRANETPANDGATGGTASTSETREAHHPAKSRRSGMGIA